MTQCIRKDEVIKRHPHPDPLRRLIQQRQHRGIRHQRVLVTGHGMQPQTGFIQVQTPQRGHPSHHVISTDHRSDSSMDSDSELDSLNGDIPEDPRPGLQRQKSSSSTCSAASDSAQGFEAFIKTLKHSIACKSQCSSLACKKMGLVLKHYKMCQETGTSRNCRVCNQLISIVTRHAQHLCQEAREGKACPVLLCDVIRREA